MTLLGDRERSACGVGFVASRSGRPTHHILAQGLHALACVEHRGACAADGQTGDGAGIMADIPFEILGYERGTVAIATIFVPQEPERQRAILDIFNISFRFFGLDIIEHRRVPTRPEVLGPVALARKPEILQVVIRRPPQCRTDFSLNQLLYLVKQGTRTRLRDAGYFEELFFVSLSSTTIVYKGLTTAERLADFYPDLRDPRFISRFALFHRRFSTNTTSTWDKAQPFRLIAHNGEINTIAGNRSWAYSREQALGLRRDELLTHNNVSDSGNFNEMVEALKYRSSIPHTEDILAIMVPPMKLADPSGYYAFWGRAMEPWDGPAFLTYCDGSTIGARLDRNGFRPCRWAKTDEAFYLSSEAGIFSLRESEIRQKGALRAGTGVKVDLLSGEIHLRDPSLSRENRDAVFDPRLLPIGKVAADAPAAAAYPALFALTDESWERLVVPMVSTGKEPIGSMGDTARPAILSEEPRPLFDYFYQDFAQVTNPPLDYLRETLVTDLEVHLGKRPNIFAPKELIPPSLALRADSPVLSLGQMAYVRSLLARSPEGPRLRAHEVDCTFAAGAGGAGLPTALERIGREALAAVKGGAHIVVLSDRNASPQHLPVPSLLALRSVVRALNEEGRRLDASVIVDSGDVHTPHDIAVLVGFGATAVCPYLVLHRARVATDKELVDLDAEKREANLEHALETGLLKVMSKMGISVVRSYQTSKLFVALGLGVDVIDAYFKDTPSPVAGLTLAQLGAQVVERARRCSELGSAPLPDTYQLREHPKGLRGEKHGMTAARSRLMHAAVRAESPAEAQANYDEYLTFGRNVEPTSLRALVEPKPGPHPLDVTAVEPATGILRRFGAGAMSFGAISKDAQRDIIQAMRNLGGRSNSGEGGENPYYFIDGTTASTKQVASARFGVTAEYLASADEIEIKIAQGAKPGEGGQLMGLKVTEEIARARHASVGVDLISPPPLHDIYSIEDLKELIYELKQLRPNVPVCVKLVAGANIGTIACGVVKAGADVVQISGGDGGTGAATISSMKHAGLPWELGLIETHRTLIAQGMRNHVRLRVDGGLYTGRDVVVAAMLGAEEFGFGKVLLVAEGCIMARICEKNRCPTGIATHDPRFLGKYKGSAEHVEAALKLIAEDVRRELARVGVTRLDDIIGRADSLRLAESTLPWVTSRGLDLSAFLTAPPFVPTAQPMPLLPPVPHQLNQHLVADTEAAVSQRDPVRLSYAVKSTERAVVTRLAGTIAERMVRDRALARQGTLGHPVELPEGLISLRFQGSAGQGFGAFLVPGLDVELFGEANDSVGKSMSGGRIVVRAALDAGYPVDDAVLIGNCALYGATGGTLLVGGIAGDRFAVRNSGALAVALGAGLHACEYMTGGTVILLGPVSYNVGAGMTGGTLILPESGTPFVNRQYLRSLPLDAHDRARLQDILTDFAQRTGSVAARQVASDFPMLASTFNKWVPIGAPARPETEQRPDVTPDVSASARN